MWLQGTINLSQKLGERRAGNTPWTDGAEFAEVSCNLGGQLQLPPLTRNWSAMWTLLCPSLSS